MYKKMLSRFILLSINKKALLAWGQVTLACLEYDAYK